jgi:hypothetical protein
MSSLGRPKKDKKQRSITDAFGIPQCSNQPWNSKNEVYDYPFEAMNQIVQKFLKRNQHLID